MANRTPAAVALCALAAVAMTACASGTPRVAASGEPSSGGSAAAASARSAPPTGATAAPSNTPSGRCVADASRVTVTPGESPRTVCLRVGAVLRIDAPASPRQPWQPFVSSDAQVLSCATEQGPDGVATATCRALRPGSSMVTTTTAPFAGDPHGPMQQRWQISAQIGA
jgi:hypothetical protein